MGYKSKSQAFFLATALSVATTSTATVIVPFTPIAKTTEDYFSDVSNHAYYAKPIQFLVDRSVLTGYSDGTFKPNEQLTRAEAAQMFVKILRIDTTNTPVLWFTDVEKDDWYSAPIAALVHEGILNGYSDGTFNPTGTITRAEMAKMLVEAYPELKKINHTVKTFTDVTANDWYSGYVAALVDAEITTGITATTFGPNEIVTRGEAATFIYRSDK